MSKVVICIHGLGNKPPKELLGKWWRASIIEGLRGIGKYIFNPKIEMVYWADVLHEKPLDENITEKENPFYLSESYKLAPKNFVPKSHPIRKKVLDFVEKQLDKIFLNEDLSINYSFISEYVIHKYFKELEIYYSQDCTDENNERCAVKDVIENKLKKILNKHKRDKIFLVSHSMGTIIAYDVLCCLIPEVKIDTFVTMGSPLGMPIIMNKIAAELNLKLHEKHKLTTPANVERHWYNFSDLEDKIAFNYNLSDDYAENSNRVRATDFIITNNYEINGVKNPHKSYGYLRTPEFSKVLYEFLIHDRSKHVRWLLNVSNTLYKRIMSK